MCPVRPVTYVSGRSLFVLLHVTAFLQLGERRVAPLPA
jgi:hypothetical protein